jgi:thiamine biosynthesis lipoprotein
MTSFRACLFVTRVHGAAGTRRPAMLALFLVSLGTANAVAEDGLTLFTFRETHLAVPVELRVYAADEAVAKDASQAAYARIDELDRIFSDYDADSEAMRLCRTDQPVRVSSDLFFLLNTSIALSERTDGAFDVTLGPLVKQWRRARRKKELPTPEQIAAAKELVGYRNLKLDESARTVAVLKAGMQLDFGGIAKGYVAEEAYKVLNAKGCPRSLVAVAGDIFAGDPPPDAPAWKIGVAPLDKPDGPPSRYLALQHLAVSTSGDAFQFVEIGGVRYSHIVDPKTGIGLTRRSSVTVVAPHGWMADGYATAVCLLGPEDGLKRIEEMKATEALVVVAEDAHGISTRESRGFARWLWENQPER